MRLPAVSLTLLRYTGALAAAGAVTALAALDNPPSTAAAGFLFLLVVVLVAAAAGTGPAVVAVAAGFLALDYYFTHPRDSFGIAHGHDRVSLALYLVVAVVIALLLGWRRRSAGHAALEAERLARLQTVSAGLAEALTPDEVLDVLVTHGVAAAEATAGLIALVSEDGEGDKGIEIVAARGYADDALRVGRRFALQAATPLSRVLESGQPEFVDATASTSERTSLRLTAGANHPFAVLPLLVEGRTIGVLGLTYRGKVDFDAERRSQKMTLARLAAQALERARHYAAEEILGERLALLSEASRTLSASLDYEQALGDVARLIVARFAELCLVDVVGEDGGLARVAIEAADARPRGGTAAPAAARELGVSPAIEAVVRTGQPELHETVPTESLAAIAGSDEQLLEAVRAAAPATLILVPLQARGRVLGAMTLVAGTARRRYGAPDLRLAEELARRAGLAIDNARLYREAERRGNAARALAYVSDGVLLLDASGAVRFLNPAAEKILGVDDGALGQPAVEVLPDWRTVAERVRAEGTSAPAVTLPLLVDGVERWVSFAAVAFGEGLVFALRDVGDERALEQARSDFVATASHELRTPVAAIYGAVRTLRRQDIELRVTDREAFLQIIEEEADRLARIVEQILLARGLESGGVEPVTGACDAAEIVRSVVGSAAARKARGVRLHAEAPGALTVHGDEDKLRQVLVNLVDNAVKYSPDGGDVHVVLTSDDGVGRIEVCDEGLGIPSGSEERIFEKFVRLDPDQRRGIGGTGLGLYICRQLVERMDGRIWVEPNDGAGSRFLLELPLAGRQ